MTGAMLLLLWSAACAAVGIIIGVILTIAVMVKGFKF